MSDPPFAPPTMTRAHTRLSTRGVVVVLADGERRTARLADLSRGGMSLVLEAPLSPGTTFHFQIVDSKSPISGRAESIWVRAADGEEVDQSMGVRFLELDQAGSARIEQLLAQFIRSGGATIDLD